MQLKDRLAAMVRALPPAQRVGIAVAVAVLAMAAVPFVQWVSSPSYTVLYSGMADDEVGEVTGELESRGYPYQLEDSRVLVPQGEVHAIRAELAQAGVSGNASVPGYELLDDQPLGVSDFRQRVDLQRAVEGELAKTLAAMEPVESANVRLVMPEDPLFTEEENPASASVLLETSRELSDQQVQAATMLVSSSVEDLSPDDITVADTSGQVLHAAGDEGFGGAGSSQQQQTREFEQAVSADIQRLLAQSTDAPASVVVRADLDFDEQETATETYDDEGTPLRQQTMEEDYEGTQAPAGGDVGVDGGPMAGLGGDGEYTRSEETTEFGVDRTTTRTVQAPGEVERLSVALVVDEEAIATDAEIEQLASAAAGLDPGRGDELAITRAPMADATDVEEPEGTDWVALAQQVIALLLLVGIGIALFLMSRRKEDPPEEKVVPAQLRPQPDPEPQAATEPQGIEGGHGSPELDQTPPVQEDVAQLVERHPEEIATLLRGWLADRRSA